MPSQTQSKQHQQCRIKIQPASRMLYENVDNSYHSMGFLEHSVRLNNPRDLNDFSSQSIVCAMDRFVKAVNNMNETIMVPCRLLDMEVGQKTSTSKVPKLLKSGGDPYSYYSLLNSVKNDLILGASSNDEDTTTDRTPVMVPSINSTRWTDEGEEKTDAKKEPARRVSTMSLASDSSFNPSETDSAESCSESTEDDDRSSEGDENALVGNDVTQALHTHLVGLHACLKNLTDTATYITDCYKESIDL